MKTNYLFFIIGLIFLNACSPIITTTRSNYPPLDDRQEVLVIGLNETKPENAIEFGQVKIGDTGATTNCTYDAFIEMAKTEARKNGGNALKILEHKLPSDGGSCHIIRALILKVDDPTKYKPIEDDIILNADYAILKIYRPSGTGALVNYDLHLGDSVICRVKSNFRAILYIKKDGLNSLWAIGDAVKEVPINIKFGKTYYLRCGLKTAFLTGQPELDLVDSQTGEEEFESINAAIQ